MDLELLESKFCGTMLGVLIGDCLGSPYEGQDTLSDREKTILQQFLDKMERCCLSAELILKYTDDSAMTKSLAQSLIKKRDVDLVDIAKRFVKSYDQEPNRGYGAGAINVLEKLREEKTDIKKPARELFDGSGSYGNGGAMRIAPMSLFFYNNYDKLLHYVKEVTQITHSHKLGINGAILQAIAIQQSLCLNSTEELNVSNFLDDLIDKMDKIEVDGSQPFKEKLGVIKTLLSEDGDGPDDEKVVQKLGVNITAIESVPTAIFCFLRAQKPIKGIKTDNPCRRAIQYAITLGGDTDTIASMTGAISGAFYSNRKIDELNVWNFCEGEKRFRKLAKQLLDVATSNDLNK